MSKDYIRGDHFVQFGDGTTSQIVDTRYSKNEEGEMIVKFLLWPSSDQKETYNLIESEDYDRISGIMIKRYRKTEVIELLRTPHKTRIWVSLTFDGRDTPASMRESMFKEIISSNEKLIKTLRLENFRLHDELRISKTQRRQATREDVDGMREVLRVRGQVKEDYLEGDETPQ